MSYPTLRGVNLSKEAFFVCASHALLTEKEEIMGLLLGDISDNIATIWGVSVLTRSDKRSDRVEISPEQLAMAADEATSLGQQIGRSTRVVGWYHSHPHITVQPSHIDLRTQSMYQQFDQGFVGLIFSVFNQEKDAAKVGKLQVIGFQSVAFQVAEERRKKLRVAELEKKRVEQQTEIAKAPIRTFGLDIPVGLFSTLNLSLGFTSVAPAASGSIPSRFDSYSSVSLFPPESSSNPDHEQVDVPILITPSYPGAPNLLHKIVQLQEILFNEARASYQEAMASLQPPHLLGHLHIQAVYQKSLCRLLEFGISPLLETLNDLFADLQSQHPPSRSLQSQRPNLEDRA